MTKEQHEELISLEYSLTQGYLNSKIDELRYMYLSSLKQCKLQTVLVSAFPGTGKTRLFTDEYPADGHPEIKDSDSSTFQKDGFPFNYVKDIIQNIGNYKAIFISSHKEVRGLLFDLKIEYLLIYPNETLKYEYISRYYNRGSDAKFIDLVNNNWNLWINELNEQPGCTHIVLQKGQFLSDIKKLFL